MIAAESAPNFMDLWELAKTAGPFATLLLMFIVYFVNKEREKERARNDALNSEIKDLLSQVKIEGDTLRERVLAALNNAVIAISTSAAGVESVRQSLQTVITFIQRGGER